MLHMRTQPPPWQAGMPFGSVGQFMQLAPQRVASLSAAQALPHL